MEKNGNKSVQSIAITGLIADLVGKRNRTALNFQFKNQAGGKPVKLNAEDFLDLKSCCKFYESELRKLEKLREVGNASQIRAKQNAIGNSFRCTKVAVLNWANRYNVKLSYEEL